MNKAIWVVLIVLVVVVLGGVWYFATKSAEKTPSRPSVKITTPSSQEATPSSTENPKVKSADLKPISPYTGSGVATRSFDGNTFIHTVMADIDDPASGKFYEGWLVKNPDTKEFFSTGKLTKEGGVYRLTFTASQNYPSHSGVVITEETAAKGLDGIPEAHVLEGSF